MSGFTKNFLQTFNRIRSLAIQGAENITYEGSKATIRQIIRSVERIPEESYTKKAYRAICDAASAKMLSARPTEPHLANTIRIALGTQSPKTKDEALMILAKGLEFIEAHHESIHKKVWGVAKEELSAYNSAYTHCHSSFVREALLHSGIRIVYNTETRPRYQGRITAKSISGRGIVHHYVDSAMSIAVEKSEVVLIGADSVTLRGDVINKIGSGMLGIVAKHHNKPLYVITDTLKLDMDSDANDTTIEERPSNEVWGANLPGLYVHNPAFELLKSEFIRGIICEKGIFTPKKFVTIARREIEMRMKN
jgi:ribose 1,5-bisphosphate isomerase